MGFVSFKDLDEETKAILDKEFEETYNKYKKLVYFIVVRIINIPNIAEEITNDTFLILYQHLNVIRDKKKIKSYLSITAKRLTYQYIKKYNAEREGLVDNFNMENYPDETARFSYFESWDELMKRFENFLYNDEIDLLVKHLYFNYTIREIAQERNQNIFTVSSQMRRLKIKLRKYYKDKVGEFYE